MRKKFLLWPRQAGRRTIEYNIRCSFWYASGNYPDRYYLAEYNKKNASIYMYFCVIGIRLWSNHRAYTRPDCSGGRMWTRAWTWKEKRNSHPCLHMRNSSKVLANYWCGMTCSFCFLKAVWCLQFRYIRIQAVWFNHYTADHIFSQSWSQGLDKIPNTTTMSGIKIPSLLDVCMATGPFEYSVLLAARSM